MSTDVIASASPTAVPASPVPASPFAANSALGEFHPDAGQELQRLTNGTYQVCRIQQGMVLATSHRDDTWFASLRFDVHPGPDGLLAVEGYPRIGSHAVWRVRVPSLTVLVSRLRAIERQVRIDGAAATRFRDQTGRPPYAGIDDRRMQALRTQAAADTYNLPF